MKLITYALSILFLGCFFSCTSSKESEKNATPTYMDHIGDTPFNAELDDVNFKFCDSTNVLHSRGRVGYTGGTPAMEKELIASYEKQAAFESFTGYFFVRFAVNCENKTGRFRWEIVDENFEKTTCSSSLETEIITKVKNLAFWNHPIYRGESRDGYTFLIVKIENGNIIPS